MTTWRLSVLSLIAVAGLVGCSKPEACKHSPGFEQYHREPKFQTPFRRSEVGTNELFGKYKKLTLGMTEKQVLDLMGEPDSAREMWKPGLLEGRCVGQAWTYYVEVSEQLSNGNNKQINIYFDHDGKTKWEVPSNLPALQERGSPRNEQSD